MLCDVRRLSLAAAVLAFASSALAQDKFTEEELLLLPRACLAQKFINRSLRSPVVPESERQMWALQLGPVYESYHHFCWGLIDMRRASMAAPKDADNHYRSAIANFDYVLRRADASFALLPEVLLRKGMALRFLGRDGDAARQFSQSIQVKDNYTPAYAALIDLYVDLNDMEGALSVLAKGLSQSPESKILLSKKRELEAPVK